MQPDKNAVREYLVGLQARITEQVAAADGGAQFESDAWQRPGGGGGESRILRNGAVFEQAGVGFSHVMGMGCRPLRPSSDPSWPARNLKPWAFRSCFIRRTPSCRQRT